ncbi:MAG: FkbM family methyltransferase [Microbacterium sp.]|uniref:FkbM family methyltransferase n=1 Tax=Microbacterium sp. TaxID=51671 RepID=UPI003D6DABBF
MLHAAIAGAMLLSSLPQLLRPAKVSNAVRRRLFERRLATTDLESYEPLVHLGTEYGGWYVPGDLITAEWLCYSVGAGNDVSFDMELIARYGARVRAFDPFVIFREMAEARAGGEPRYSFHEVAITASDGPVQMFGRQDTEQGAVSAVNLYGVRTSFTKPGRSLLSLMAEFGDDRVDLLKMDVEGSEYELVPTLDLDRMGVRVLCLELHHNESVGRARALLHMLRQRGFAPVHRKHPTSFTFVRG